METCIRQGAFGQQFSQKTASTMAETIASFANSENCGPHVQHKRNALKNGQAAAKKGRTALGDISNRHALGSIQPVEKSQRTKADRASVTVQGNHNQVTEEILDIDASSSDPTLTCPEYAVSIFTHLRETESDLLPTPQYMNTPHNVLTPNMRGTLIDWLVEVAEEFKLCTDTMFMAVQLIDRFIAKQHVARENLQLVGVACMWIAAKYEEIYPPTVREFAYITDSTYTAQQVIDAEATVLAGLSFRLTAPSIKIFLRRFLQAAQPDERMHFMASYFSELSLLEYDLVGQLPSLVAAACVLLARIVLGHQQSWNATLQFYTGYSPAQLRACVTVLANLHVRVSTEQDLRAVSEKYSSERFACVARLAPVHALQVLLDAHHLGAPDPRTLPPALPAFLALASGSSCLGHS